MITMEQALTAREFHRNGCARTVGPRGGVTVVQETWRRNGQTQTWKTRPGHFRVPVTYGLRGYDQLTHREAADFHAAEDCPLRQGGTR